MRKKLLICGATGFIGRNLLNAYRNDTDYEVFALYRAAPIADYADVTWVQGDLRDPAQVDRCVRGMDVILQAAATTSGAKDIVTQPYIHVTDNAVMNALLFRACHQHRVGRLVFFSCTTMYASSPVPVREEGFRYEIPDKYFGVGWTKVYNEKMCEFYARLGPTRCTVVRHSNIYGPFDKFDLERSHVFGATVTKVMTAAENGSIVVWGDGSEIRDLLYVDDLVDFVRQALVLQSTPYELVNVGAGAGISVRGLVEQIIAASGKNLTMTFDRSRPTINFDLVLNIERAGQLFQWSPQISLAEGIRRTLDLESFESRV